VRLRAVFLLGIVILLAGCGSKHHAATTTATTTTATTLNVYFYRNAALVPAVVQVPQTQAVGTAALEALLAGPPSGYTSALPTGGQLNALSIVDGTATAHFNAAMAGLTRSAQAQVVYTLTQFGTVHGVEATAGANPVVFEGGNDLPLTAPATRDDFVDLTALAPIFVAAPLRDSTVSGPVVAQGTADVFEGTLQVDVYSGGKKLATETITATSGTGTRGTWHTVLTVPPGAARLAFYEPSAEDGSHLHETDVSVTVR
jgi:hypothetical protein